jgi:hypothetical protein
MDHVVVKYHNRRMLLTVDLETLFTTLFDAFGEDVSVRFVPMNESERRESSEIVDFEIIAVRERFQIFEASPGEHGMRRRQDLEQTATGRGQK